MGQDIYKMTQRERLVVMGGGEGGRGGGGRGRGGKVRPVEERRGGHRGNRKNKRAISHSKRRGGRGAGGRGGGGRGKGKGNGGA